MKYFIIVLLLFQFFSLTAQRIHLTDTANQWMVTHAKDGEGPFDCYRDNLRIIAEKDTIAFNHTYKKLTSIYVSNGNKKCFGNVTPYTYLIREDTLLQQAWLLGDDSLEHILYNHNWQVNDTIHWGYGPPHQSYAAGKFFITRIDSTSINGQWHRVFHVINSNSSTGYFAIIEGVGSTCGPAFAAYPNTFEDSWTLNCYVRGAGNPEFSPPVNTGAFNSFFENRGPCTMGISENALMPVQATIIPNPASSRALLQLSRLLEHGHIVVYNTSGQLVYQSSLQGRTFPIGAYLQTPGLYYYQVRQEEKGTILSGRFIFE